MHLSTETKFWNNYHPPYLSIGRKFRNSMNCKNRNPFIFTISNQVKPTNLLTESRISKFLRTNILINRTKDSKFLSITTKNENNLSHDLRACNDLKKKKLKRMNRDSHIASSPISQSFFFEEVCCLILASS